MMRTQVYISHSTKLIYYILTHLSRSLFLKDGQNQTNVTWAKRASGSAKKKTLLITFQDTYVRETMFSRKSKFLRMIFFEGFCREGDEFYANIMM